MVKSNQESKQVQLSPDQLDTYIKQMMKSAGSATVDIVVLALLCGIIYKLFVAIRRFF